MFYVYLLHSAKDNGFYIGFSTDSKRRLSEHTRGASFATKSRGPWKLIYYEAYTEREDAEGREKFLKSGAGRRFLRAQLRHYLKRFPEELFKARITMFRMSTKQPREAKPFTREKMDSDSARGFAPNPGNAGGSGAIREPSAN